MSLCGILDESWTGSRLYILRQPKLSTGENLTSGLRNNLSDSSMSNADEVAIEIQVKQLTYMGVPSRLVLLRNVDYIIEQQKLETKASFERQLTNTLSHELLTPLNCIINVSEGLHGESKDSIAQAKA